MVAAVAVCLFEVATVVVLVWLVVVITTVWPVVAIALGGVVQLISAPVQVFVPC